MHTIGPYRFSEQDARRTVELYPAIWAQLEAGRDATTIAALRVQPGGEDLASDLAAVWGSLAAAGPTLRDAGQLPATTTGHVVQLNRSSGGVPKVAVPAVDVSWRGVAGDVQRARQHHGRPWQALCIWSLEVIEALNAQGHHLVPGATGENVTVAGLPWAEVRAGVRLALGSVLCEVSSYTEPCSKNARWFAGGDFRVMHASRGPVSRVYATVLEPGRVETGDPAILEP